MRYRMNKKGQVIAAKPQPLKENKVHKNCIKWFDMQYPRLSQLMFHIPNGGKRDAAEAQQFKYMGVRAGVPDLFLSVPAGGCHGLYIEMKRLGSYQSDKQKEFERKAHMMGYMYAVAETIEQFIDIVQAYLRTTPHYKGTWKQTTISNR